MCVSKDARELKGGQWSGERLAPNRVPDDLTEKILPRQKYAYMLEIGGNYDENT